MFFQNSLRKYPSVVCLERLFVEFCLFKELLRLQWLLLFVSKSSEFLITETKALLLFLSFFRYVFFFNMVPWVFKRHFNLACTISYGCINNPSEPTAFLRNLKQEPIVDPHFKLIHPAVGRKNCDSTGFLSTISFFHRC